MVFKSAWWSVELPNGWSGHSEENCVTFRATPPLGALRISAARKETGFVTDRDLKEFSDDRVTSEMEQEGVLFGVFSGNSVKYRKDGFFWQEWWLRSKHLMLYVTYNVVERFETSERDSIEAILNSLVA
jgi:hypothetical protein